MPVGRRDGLPLDCLRGKVVDEVRGHRIEIQELADLLVEKGHAAEPAGASEVRGDAVEAVAELLEEAADFGLIQPVEVEQRVEIAVQRDRRRGAAEDIRGTDRDGWVA